jgi:hypothetical protein
VRKECRTCESGGTFQPVIIGSVPEHPTKGKIIKTAHHVPSETTEPDFPIYPMTSPTFYTASGSREKGVLLEEMYPVRPKYYFLKF